MPTLPAQVQIEEGLEKYIDSLKQENQKLKKTNGF